MSLERRPGVLVTGAAGSIGRAVVASLVHKGIRCFAWDVAPAPFGADVEFEQCDVLDELQLESATQRMTEASCSLRHVMAIVGGGDLDELQAKDVLAESRATFERVIAVNLTSAFLTVKAVLPLLRAGQERYDRSITLVSSINAYGGFGAPAYSAAKAGLTGLARSLAPSLGADHVRINTLSLGTVRTDHLHDLHRALGRDPEQHIAGVASKALLGRVLTPDDVSAALLAIAFDLRGLTGADVILDNGQLLSR